MDKQMLNALGYRINERKFKDIKELLQERDLIKFQYPANEVIYKGAEYSTFPKLPNITVLPNLQMKTLEILLGTTLGHQHTQSLNGDAREFQEIYEFQTYGGLLLRNSKRTVLYLLRPTEKALVSTEDNMTLFNFNQTPLVTLDYANPSMNNANKELEKKIKTMLMVYFNPEKKKILFEFNPRYYPDCLKSNPKELQVEFSVKELGEELYEEISRKRAQFERLGIEVKTETNIPEKLREKLKPALLNLALGQNETLLDLLKIAKA